LVMVEILWDLYHESARLHGVQVTRLTSAPGKL
jgi:hypothetical protein